MNNFKVNVERRTYDANYFMLSIKGINSTIQFPIEINTFYFEYPEQWTVFLKHAMIEVENKNIKVWATWCVENNITQAKLLKEIEKGLVKCFYQALTEDKRKKLKEVNFGEGNTEKIANSWTEVKRFTDEEY